MKRLLLFLFSLTFFSLSFAQIYEPEGINMPGSWNDWKNPPDNALFLANNFQVTGGRIHRVDVRQHIYRTWFTTKEDGDLAAGGYQFLFTSGPSDDPWKNKWTDVIVKIDTVQQYIYHNDGGGANDSVYLKADKFYIVNWKDSGYQNTEAIFMELSYRPAFIDTVIHYPEQVNTGDTVCFVLKVDTIPPEEQKFYVLYTTNNWATSQIVACQATDSAFVGSLVIENGVTDVEYYAFSSVVDSPEANFDLVTVTFNDNNGEFYNFSVQQPPDTSCDLRVSAVYPQPPLPVEDSGVVLWFDATLGNGALANYTGDIYAHTGVITNKSPDSTYWLHIVSDWGDNDAKLKFTRVATNLYKLEIPNIREFYNITDPTEHVEKIALVIRSGEPIDPSNPDEFIVAREEDGSDFFVKVYQQNELAAKILTPNNYHNLYANGEPVRICGASIYADSTQLYVDDSLVATSDSGSISVLLQAGSLLEGNHLAKIIAYRGTSQVAYSQRFIVLPPVQIADLPAGLGNGVTFRNDTVYFVLWDPPALKHYAFVIGDFNDWQPDVNYFMKRTPDGKHFWLGVTGLNPDNEYGYQFYIDGRLRLADPYAHKVLDPWNDKYIPSYNYPDLKPYPSGKTYGIVSTFKINSQPYSWEVPNFVPPALNEKQPDLTVYELLVRDFVKSSALKDVTAKLDYIKNLGINAIEIMPINEFEGNISWGYNPDFYFAVDKYYGTSNDFKHFVDECHKRGIAVILDVVFNHSFGLCPLVQMYWDAQNNVPAADNPWYNQVAPHPLSPGYDFNHESPDTRKFVKDVLKYWLTEYKVDGFRFDLSKGFTQKHTTDIASWSAYDQSRIDILEDYFDFIKSINPNAYVVLEHFANNDEEQVLANYGFLLWQNMSTQYGQALMGWADNSDFSWSYYKNRGFAYPNNLVFMESHDEERLMYKALEWGNSTSSYSVKDLSTALDREKGLVAFWATVPGPKMMWQFGELGYDYSIDYCSGTGEVNEDCRTTPKPVRWDYVDDTRRQALYNVYRKILNWKTSNAIFRLGDFSQNTGGIVKEQWISSDTLNIYIVANFDVASQQVNLNFQHTGTWFDVLSGKSLDVSSTPMAATLAPGEYHIYTDKNEQLVNDVILGIKGQKDSKLLLYPNPAYDLINLNLEQPAKIKIYTLEGKLIKQVNYSPQHPVNISNLRAGAYIITVETADNKQNALFIKQ